jgi:hypothetical protein
MRRAACVSLALAALSSSCSGGGNQLVDDTTTTERQVEDSTTTTALSAEDPAESAFISEIEQRIGSAVDDEWMSSTLELARTVCAMLDETSLADDEALDALFDDVDEGAQEAELALIFTVGAEHLCPQHTETLSSYVASRGIELPA